MYHELPSGICWKQQKDTLLLGNSKDKVDIKIEFVELLMIINQIHFKEE